MMDPRILSLPVGHPRRVRAEEYYNSPKYIQDQVVLRVQNMLDAFAKERGYDSITSACSYATSKVEKFAAEASICVNLRDAAWAACYQIMNDIKAGKRPMPTIEQAIAELPEFKWE